MLRQPVAHRDSLNGDFTQHEVIKNNSESSFRCMLYKSLLRTATIRDAKLAA